MRALDLQQQTFPSLIYRNSFTQIRLSLPGDAHLALWIRWEQGNGVKQLLGGCSIANIPGALLEGLNPRTIPQDGAGPQGHYKPAINP